MGYIFLSNYYTNFGIDITYYLSLSDILFVSLGILITLAITLLIVDVVINLITQFLFSLKNPIKGPEEKPFKNYKDEQLFNSFSFHFSGLCIFYLLVFVLSYIIVWDFYLYVIMFVYTPLKISGAGKNLDNTKKLGDDIMVTITGTFVTVILLGASFFYGHYEALSVKNSRSIWFSKQTEFNYNGEFYTTFKNDKLIFFGETSNNIFLYNTQSKKSSVFYKTKLDNLVFYTPEVLENDQELENKKINDFQIYQIRKKTAPGDSISN